MRSVWVRVLVLLAASSGCLIGSLAGQDSAAVQSEEAVDYFERWLKEEVVYIITPEERSVFQALTTDQEKEQFIEQFWFRRDSDPATAVNEFREEHYRRIAYANENFFSAIPGWRTDRGRVYIIHGPPASIESHTAGEPYHRPMHEGGGSTVTYPFEIWRYRHIEGLGSDIEIEFVDPSMTGEFRFARHAEEKDAFLLTPGLGLTTAERLGLAERKDRPYFNPGSGVEYPLMYQRQQDNLFERYERIAFLQRPPEIKYKDLKEQVTVEVTFENSLPFTTRHDYFRLNDTQVLVPVTLELQNRDLSFQEAGGGHRARLAIYGMVTSLTNRVVTEFEDDLAVSFAAGAVDRGIHGRSMYQKILLLDLGMRYRLDLVVKELQSGKVGVLRKAIVPPSFGGEKLVASTLVLTDFIRQLDEVPGDSQMFVLGDIWIRPSLSRSFRSGGVLGVYFQLYHIGIDQNTLGPALEIHYAVKRGDETVLEQSEEAANYIQYYSDERVVLINGIPLDGLAPDRYQIQVRVKDKVRDAEVTLEDAFQIAEPADLASN